MGKISKENLMKDGENQAVSAFLDAYRGGRRVLFSSMCEDFRYIGLDGVWPDWVEDMDNKWRAITEKEAQDWLRYLFALENNARQDHERKA